MFCLCLVGIALTFEKEANQLADFHADEEVVAQFEGNDWVNWENSPEGVIAKQVHPLPGYKPYDKLRLKSGDRLVEMDENLISSAEVVDQITKAARPGHFFRVEVERQDPYTLQVEQLGVLFRNGFRLSFGFNDHSIYWHLSGWMFGIGAFITLIVLVILLPLVRKTWREYLTLLGLVVTALLFFVLQLFRHIYLIVESDLVGIGGERLFMIAYVGLLFSYIVYYLYFKANLPNLLFVLPSALTGGFLLFRFYQLIYLGQTLTYYHELIERYTALFFLLHLTGALFLFITGSWDEKSRSNQQLLWLTGIIALAGFGLWYFAQGDTPAWLHSEHVLFGYYLLLFFPLINATFLQLQFGRASLVITQSLQYLVAFVMSVILYLLIIQLFEYLRPSIQYRNLLEFVTFLTLLLVIRLVYLANENKLSRYFVSQQREKLTKFKTFIASISRYTSVANLRYDLIDQLSSFFNAENVHLWWREPSPEGGPVDGQVQVKVYQTLNEQHTVWSKTKEISPLRLADELEKSMQASPYTLICPITIDDENYGMLMLGKKKRGVYNLSDLELISQLIQQTQLTLNVLQLVTREKELIQQTYEANLTALRSQINPHFLFNTLNCIGELVHESADLAEQATEKLAFIFRYTLNKSSQQFVSLQEEMRLIKTYLDLEKIRFGDRL
ncbi:MAG: histidine kinase, partial [Bacteroidota bacterium]